MQAGNGISKGELKVKGGKLVKCTLSLKDGKIKSVKFTGDFFMYPEEKIEELEKMLEGIECTDESIRNEIAPFFDGVELMGASMEDFITVISMAIKNLKGGK